MTVCSSNINTETVSVAAGDDLHIPPHQEDGEIAWPFHSGLTYFVTVEDKMCFSMLATHTVPLHFQKKKQTPYISDKYPDSV